MWRGINGDIAFTLDGHYYLGCGARGGREREVVYWVDDDLGDRKRTTASAENGQDGRSIELHARPKSDTEWGGETMSTVRRLTPLECERLQGYPDGWTDIGEWTDSKGKVHKDADSPRYKALGNSIALPFWMWLAKRISAQYYRPATMASLFDGIGGFPLAFERAGVKAVWASEIEEFPIAVTKIRFKEKEK